MTMNQARAGLLAIFVICLLVQLIAFFAAAHRMWPEDLQSLVLKVLAIYSVHLTVILGGILAQPKGPIEDPPAGLAWTAATLVLLWNGLLVWRSLSFSIATQDSTADLIKYLDGVASSSSFLVTGVLTYFFTKGTNTVRPSSNPRTGSGHAITEVMKI